jgi:hypothetical protein
MNTTTSTELTTYEISALRFVPGYNDWDFDMITVQAQSEEEAMKKFRTYKWIYKALYIKALDSDA